MNRKYLEWIPPRRLGKSWLMERLLSAHIKDHPDAEIATWRDGEWRIEKPVKELGPAKLSKPE